jgi:hypothetical protein
MAATSEFRYDGSVRSSVGTALTGLSVAILTQPANTSTQPGSPLASIFAAPVTNSASLSSASWLNGVMTFVFSAAPPADVVVGSYLQITGGNPAGYNGVWQVVSVSGNNVTVTTPFTLLSPANPGAYVSGGTVATSALPNPFLTDSLGNFDFYAPAGTYTIQIYDTSGRMPNPLVFADQAIVAGGAGAGSVTSVGLTMPAEFAVAGSPIVGAGSFAVTKANQNANLVYAGPGSGGAAAPTFRSLVALDLPAGTGTVTSVGIALVVPGILTGSGVAGSPIVGAGTITITLTLANQNANLVFAGPAAGGAAAPTFRALTTADAPGGLGMASTTTPLSSANILALLGTPITLVAAPGVGFRIVPLSIIIVFFGGSAAYTDAGGAVQFKIGATSLGALAANAIFLVTQSPNKRTQAFDWPGETDTAGNPSDSENQPLQISKVTNNFAAGNGTAKVYVEYVVIPTT